MERDSVFSRAVVVVVALAVLVALVDSAMSRREARQGTRVLVASGDAYAEAEPDVARITLGVKAVKPTPQEAATQVASTVAAIRAKLASLGVPPDAVETSELYLGEATTSSGYPKYKITKVGYKAYHWLRVTLKREAFAKLAAVVNGAVMAGATRLSGLSFEMEDETPLRSEALQKATERARIQAEAMAKGSGARLDGVQGVEEKYGDGYEYRVTAKRAVPAAAAPGGGPGMAAPAEAPAGQPEPPDKLRLSCTVQVTYRVR
jgi:hypothetical protein